jgi:hypothetical protein
MNAGIDVKQIQRFGAFYILTARLRSISKWKAIIAAVDIGNPLFYLVQWVLELVSLFNKTQVHQARVELNTSLLSHPHC